MSTKSLREFLDKIGKDESLRDELTGVVKKRDDKEAAAAEVAARHGFEFDAVELQRILDAAQGTSDTELTEDELEAVAAGLTVFQQIRFAPPYVPVGLRTDKLRPPSDIGGLNIP